MSTTAASDRSGTPLSLAQSWAFGYSSKTDAIRKFRRDLWNEHLEMKDDALQEREQGRSIAELWAGRASEDAWKKKRIVEWAPAKKK